MASTVHDSGSASNTSNHAGGPTTREIIRQVQAQSRVRAIVLGHLDNLVGVVASRQEKRGKHIAQAIIAAAKSACRAKHKRIEGSSRHVLAELAPYWPGPLPKESGTKTVRFALEMLASVSPFFIKVSCHRWALALELGKVKDPKDPTIIALASGEQLPPKRKRVKSATADGFSVWCAKARKAGRIWGEATARMLLAAGSVQGSTMDVARLLLTGHRAVAELPLEGRKWAKRIYTPRERIGVARTLERLASLGLIDRSDDVWSVSSKHFVIGASADATVEHAQPTDLELSFLSALGRHRDVTRASKEVGIHQKLGLRFTSKLAKTGLVDKSTLAVPQDLVREVEPLRSVFGSPKACELFSVLREKHSFVFPEQPVCSIVQIEAVKHLFTEEWHRYYYLVCRLDFVVCAADGRPLFAYEYQGGYHDDPDQKVKDDFKRAMCEAAGLRIDAIDSVLLKRMKENRG